MIARDKAHAVWFSHDTNEDADYVALFNFAVVRVEALPEPAERQHVAVREASLGHMVLPELTALEHI